MMEKFLTRKMAISLAEKYYQDMYHQGVPLLNYPLLNDAMTTLDRKKQDPESKILYTGNVTVERGARIHATLPTLDPGLSVQFIGKCSKNLADDMKQIAGEQAANLHIEGIRSEEHTSELQSRGHLVCRLLLEKKKKNKTGSKRITRIN